MTENLLPNFFKKIGLSVGIMALLIFLLNDFYFTWLNIDQTRWDWILKIILLISLVTIVFSKDKYETKEISDLRLQNLKDSIGAGIVILLLSSFKELIFRDGDYDVISSFGLIIFILIIHLVTFNNSKNKLKVES